MAPSFAPRAAVRRLEAAGLEPPVAEAIAAAIVSSRSGLATRADLEAALTGARADIRSASAGVERRLTPIGVVTAGPPFLAFCLSG